MRLVGSWQLTMLRERLRVVESAGGAAVLADAGVVAARDARIAALEEEVRHLKLANEQLKHRYGARPGRHVGPMQTFEG